MKDKYIYIPEYNSDHFAFYEFINDKIWLESFYQGKIKNATPIRSIFGKIKYIKFDLDKNDERNS